MRFRLLLRAGVFAVLTATQFLTTPVAQAASDDMPMPAAAANSVGQMLLTKVMALTGTWDAKTQEGTLTDVFQPFANGTAVLGEELMNGKQITSTVFYVVHGELYADHYCDYENQPRYTAVPSTDPAVLDFEFRDATNLDTHPVHFHYARWRLSDATHMVQDWYVMGGKKPVSQVHLEFTKRGQ